MRALRRAVNKLQVFYIYQIKFALDLFVVEVFRNSVSKWTEGDLPAEQAEDETQDDDDNKQNDENYEHCHTHTHTHAHTHAHTSS